MRQVTSFWFKISSIEEPDSITEDMDSEINRWADRTGAIIINTSMCVEPVRNVLYVLVTWEPQQ